LLRRRGEIEAHELTAIGIHLSLHFGKVQRNKPAR